MRQSKRCKAPISKKEKSQLNGSIPGSAVRNRGIAGKIGFRSRGPYRVLEPANPGSYIIHKLQFRDSLDSMVRQVALRNNQYTTKRTRSKLVHVPRGRAKDVKPPYRRKKSRLSCRRLHGRTVRCRARSQAKSHVRSCPSRRSALAYVSNQKQSVHYKRTRSKLVHVP